MSEAENMDWKDEEGGQGAWPQPGAVGSPLSRGSGRRPLAAASESRQLAPPPGRPLTNSSGDLESSHGASSVDRVMQAFRSAMPFVQRLLPLLDGNVASTVANVLTSQVQKAAPQAQVNLAPIENSIGELQAHQTELGFQVQEQNSTLKRVQDQLEMVREATDRNTLEQQELMEDLKTVGSKVNIVALVALALLAVSVLLNLFLYLHIERVLP